MTPERAFQPRYGCLSMRLAHRRMQLAARYITGRSVLDAGCNVAELVRFLPSNIAYAGMEVLPEVVGYNRRRLPEHVFVQADIEEAWPSSIVDRDFDHVVLLAVIEHLEGPAAVLEQARRVLAPHGTVILTTPHPRARWLHEFGARLGLLSSDASEEHERLYDRSCLAALASSAGLRVVHYRPFQLRMNQLAVLRRAPP